MLCPYRQNPTFFKEAETGANVHRFTHTHTHTKGLMQLLPPHPVTSRDECVLKQPHVVLFVFLHSPTVRAGFLSVHCSRSRPVGGRATGEMCQMQCCGYLSHNRDESGNTLFIPRVRKQYLFPPPPSPRQWEGFRDAPIGPDLSADQKRIK